MLFTVDEVLEVTAGTLWLGDRGRFFGGAAIDSREIRGGELFFPVQGENENGHIYITDAIRRGAAGSLIEWSYTDRYSRDLFPQDGVIIAVDDSLTSMHKLAFYHRGKHSIPLVAVTGSNGKTTTKDFIASVLSAGCRVLKTEGNLNNHLGLPLMLFRLSGEHDTAVLELGMSGPGEIALLTSLCRPSLGVITNIGEAHMELLGSRENIARAKGELLDTMSPGGVALLNGDDPFLRSLGGKFAGRVVYYGFEKGAHIRALSCGIDGLGYSFQVELPGGSNETFWIPIPGRHNVYNALAAVAAGLHFSLKVPQIAEGLAGCSFSRMRMERTLLKGGFWVINDAYNANPTSMKFALQSLVEWAGDSVKIAVLGDMLELGPVAEEGHRAVGRYLAELKIDYLITVGELAAKIAMEAGEAGMPRSCIFEAADHDEAFKRLQILHLPGSFVLVKGSRGMCMERVVEKLLDYYDS